MGEGEKTSEEVLNELDSEEKKKKSFKKEPIKSRISKDDVEILKREEKHKNAEKVQEERRKQKERQLEEKRKREAKQRRINKLKRKFNLIKKIVQGFDDEDKQWIKKFIPYIFINGALLNFALFCVFNIPFQWYSFIGFGILMWYIENNFVSFVRSLWKEKLV